MTTGKAKKIEELADYAALKKFAASLWQVDSGFHGAAVMVGAGFSRCGATAGDAGKRLALWGDFSTLLAEELESTSATDPLRLAEEYSAYFGKQALHDLVVKEINDSAWTPGPLFNSLLELPWSEVLTTNWDTLLERAAQTVNDPVYSIVRRQEELSSACSPRIVKLHGTINVTDELVFTQEDYRRYPHRHATFVNFARQVFVENELCLIGFSGDDPNFLQWAGWVRDQLPVHARRIYLVGALSLTSAKRKYLESINIAPIDLAEVVAEFDDREVRHFEALKIFLETLKNLRPTPTWKWEPTSLHPKHPADDYLRKSAEDSRYAASLFKQQLPTLEADRISYPGWLICPKTVRSQLLSQISAPFPNPKNMAELDADSKTKLLYEIAWRRRTAFDATPQWLCAELVEVCDPAVRNVLSRKQQLEIALHLLNSTRWMDEAESNEIRKRTTAILEANLRHWPELAAELIFYQALVARDGLDYAALEKLTESLPEVDSVWKMRKASLLSEVGRFERAEQLLAEAYRDLSAQHRNDRNSIYVFSRLAWAHWMLRGTSMRTHIPSESFPAIYDESKCNPFDEINHLKKQVALERDRENEKRQIAPLFAPGSYTDNSNVVTFDSEPHPLLLLDAISRDAGMPLRWGTVGFLTDPTTTLSQLDGLEDKYRIPLSIRSASSETSGSLQVMFSRVRVASMDISIATSLRERTLDAMQFWLKQINGKERADVMSRLRVLIEVTARTSVRSEPEAAIEVFRLAMKLGKMAELHHHWMFEPLQHLIEYSMASIPAERQCEVLPDALSFPLPCEIENNSFRSWPNPIVECPGRRTINASLDRRIDELIEGIATVATSSGPALARLLPLIDHNFLSQTELDKIADAVWPDNAKTVDLPVTGLPLNQLLRIPSPKPERTRLRIRKALFGGSGEDFYNGPLLAAIVNATSDKETPELPDPEQALSCFEALVQWRLPSATTMEVERRQALNNGKLIGIVLSRSVVPSLPETAVTEENFSRLHSFFTDNKASSALTAFPYFAKSSALCADVLEASIRQGMHNREAEVVSYASFALLNWRQLTENAITASLISHMIYVIASGRSPGLAELLWTAREMYNKGWLADLEVGILINNLPILFDERNYPDIDIISREAVSASFVRAACIKLARDIQKQTGPAVPELVRILEAAQKDPLPEVRFA
jgi:hypothetical protein